MFLQTFLIRSVDLLRCSTSIRLKVSSYRALVYANFVPKMHRFEVFAFTMTLKPGLAVTQGH